MLPGGITSRAAFILMQRQNPAPFVTRKIVTSMFSVFTSHKFKAIGDGKWALRGFYDDDDDGGDNGGDGQIEDTLVVHSCTLPKGTASTPTMLSGCATCRRTSSARRRSVVRTLPLRGTQS